MIRGEKACSIHPEHIQLAMSTKGSNDFMTQVPPLLLVLTSDEIAHLQHDNMIYISLLVPLASALM